MKIRLLSTDRQTTVDKTMSVSRALSLAPRAREIFRAYGIRFIGRDLSPLESIERVAVGNGLSPKDVERMITDINESLKAQDYQKEHVLLLTPAAADQLQHLLAARPGKKGIRLRLVSDGCAAYTYDMDFGTKAVGGEIEVESRGVRFFLEKKIRDLIQGTEIDYSTERGGFLFRNPNVRAEP
jgi:iron-sulfur cluster assembly protein